MCGGGITSAWDSENLLQHIRAPGSPCFPSCAWEGRAAAGCLPGSAPRREHPAGHAPSSVAVPRVLEKGKPSGGLVHSAGQPTGSVAA